jgi:hypothetical protein
MHALGHDDYLRLREGARVVEGDEFGDKVLLLPDGTYLKLFRRKRLVTSAAWKPYACRFVGVTHAPMPTSASVMGSQRSKCFAVRERRLRRPRVHHPDTPPRSGLGRPRLGLDVERGVHP